jgi:hypothetical protein
MSYDRLVEGGMWKVEGGRGLKVYSSTLGRGRRPGGPCSKRPARRSGPTKQSIGPLTSPSTFAGSPPGTGAWLLAHPRNDLWDIRLPALEVELTGMSGGIN